MLNVVLITRLIFQMNVSSEMKTKLSSCVFYGVKSSRNLDLNKRLRDCVKELNIDE